MTCKKEGLKSRKGKVFINNLKLYPKQIKSSMKQYINSKIKVFHSLEKPILFYYPTDYNPTDRGCSLTSKELRDIITTSEYYRLPDPYTNLIWVDVYEGDEGSFNSKSDSNDSSSIIDSISDSNDLIKVDDEEFFQYLKRKIV